MTRKKKGWLLLAGVLVPVLCWVYMQLIERTWIDETEIRLPCPAWEKGGELKFAVLADLHARPGDGAYLDEIVRRTLVAQPDAVLLLGDYLNGHEKEQGMSPEELERHLRPLAEAGLPLFAVLGNHDYYHGSETVRRMLTNLGAQIVDNGAGKLLRLEKCGVAADIGGMRCLCYYRTPGSVVQPRGNIPLILLSHSPVGAEYAAPGTFIVISGHTHGGQVCWPWGTPFNMVDEKVPRRYASGMVEIAGQRTYVTRGLGTSLLPIRLFCRPELTILTLAP